MSHLVVYNRLKDAVSSGSEAAVYEVLGSDVINHDIHNHLCAAEFLHYPPLCSSCEAFCSSCEDLLSEPVEREDFGMVRLLLEHGAYPSSDICAYDRRYRYGCKRSTPLKLAVESGLLDDVRRLLSHEADVNAHPKFCVRGVISPQKLICSDCDTPLMAAVRREDIAMIRLLIAHGANVSEKVHGCYGNLALVCSRKTTLLVAVCTENKAVITELVTSGADVNQSLGPIGTALHFCHNYHQIVELLVQLGANPNITDDNNWTAVTLVLFKCHVYQHSKAFSFRQSLRAIVSVTRDLDAVLLANRGTQCLWNYPLASRFVKVFLQHGARIRYCQMYLTGSAKWASDMRKHRKIHSERFLDLLRAADTDFSGVRQRIASVDKDEWAPLNLVVLDQKLSQPLTLQAWCVIRVRRQFRSVSDRGLWARIEKLSLPPIIKDQLKLIIW